jgi:hypothetical protein
MFEAFIKYVLGEFRMIWDTPLSFATCVAAVFLITWFAMDWRYGGVISNKDSELSLAKAQRDDYRDKLGGATPDQAKAKIEALEKTVSLTIGSKWEPLTKAEIDLLSKNLGAAPTVKVQVMYENALGKDLAQSFYGALKLAGWNATFGPGGGLGYGISTGQGSVNTLTIKKAIEAAASKIKVEIQRADQPEWPGLIFLAVGVNSSP